MTRDVITVTPDTSIHEAARLMIEHRVSGLPVVSDEGRLLGIVSDGDLIVRHRKPKPSPWWRRFFEDGERLAREYQRAVGTTAGEVMTRPVVTISPVFGIETAASILMNRSIRRLPVVLDGKLVGIVSRGDLIKALAMSAPGAEKRDSPTDRAEHERGGEHQHQVDSRPEGERQLPAHQQDTHN